MKKYIFLQNILTPYRISFFNSLHQNNFNFKVFYMRKTEADRSWVIDQTKIQYPFYLDKGFYKMIGRFHIHFNPRLIFKFFKEKDVEFILGSWNDLDVVIIIILKRLGILKNTINFWSEANYLTIGAINDNKFKYLFRQFIFNTIDGILIIPGEMSKITFQRWGIKKIPFVNLPNTIEEDMFSISNEEIEKRNENILPIYLTPVRLSEKIKGVINFFESIGNENIRKGVFLIAGDGPDKNKIEDFIFNNRLTDHIKLLGFCNSHQIQALYKQSNVLILPSYSDPSPLAVVEALAMELPLLISDRCGNHFEAVTNGENGYIFEPSDKVSVKNAYETLLSRRREWRMMGKSSYRLYEQHFKKQNVINRFISKLE